MPEVPVATPPSPLARGLVAVAWAGVVGLAILAVQIGLVKAFSVDEFTYSHGAWLLSKGMLPFRDFFETRFPFHYVFLSLPFLWRGDEPAAIGQLRIVMLVFLAILCTLVYRLSGIRRRTSGVFALLLLLGSVDLVAYATEIRPDPVGLTFFLASLAVLSPPSRLGGRQRAIASGALLALSCLASLKAVVYGAAFVPIWILDVVVNAPRKRPCILGAPWIFAGVVFGIAAVVVLLLVATGSWDDFYRLAILRSAEFVGPSTTRMRLAETRRLLATQSWTLPFIAIGWIDSLQATLRSRQLGNLPEWILLLSLPSSLLSYLIQSYAFEYSFIPFLALLAIFGGRGVAALLEWSVSWGSIDASSALSSSARKMASHGVPVVLAMVLVAELSSARPEFSRLLGQTNKVQLASLEKLGELTAPEDPVYDNSGSYVARFHAYSPHHTDAFMRREMKNQLAAEVPVALYENGAVAIIRDWRMKTLSIELKRFLRRHYQPYSDYIWLWGQRYEPTGQRFEAEFLANRSDRYFVKPASALSGGQLAIDGRVIREPVFSLEKGRHRLVYRGPARIIQILWLPRNEERYEPVVRSGKYFSRILVRPRPWSRYRRPGNRQ